MLHNRCFTSVLPWSHGAPSTAFISMLSTYHHSAAQLSARQTMSPCLLSMRSQSTFSALPCTFCGRLHSSAGQTPNSGLTSSSHLRTKSLEHRIRSPIYTRQILLFYPCFRALNTCNSDSNHSPCTQSQQHRTICSLHFVLNFMEIQ